MRRTARTLVVLALAACTATPSDTPSTAAGVGGGPIDWNAVNQESLAHFQALLRFDTRDPPGNESLSAAYVEKTLKDAGIETKRFALEPNRPNIVARIKGNGSKRPLLIMGHQDVVSVDTTKWRFGPFAATLDSGWVYGRGAVDDKDNLAAGLMLMLLLKRQGTPLDRDVIFLAEVGEEGSTQVGIRFMTEQHFAEIDAEYCFAEGGSVARVGGKVAYAGVSTTEKIPRAITLTARGTAGHGSVPLQSNAVVHLSAAIAKFAAWRPPVRLNETTRAYFTRLATIAPPEKAARYRDIVSGDPKKVAAADDWLLANEPSHSSMLRTSISPTIVNAGYRVNVIPSEAVATLDVRALPDEDTTAFITMVRNVVADPAVEVAWGARNSRPGTPVASLDAEAFKAIEAAMTANYAATTLPTMLTGATDMAFVRAKGVQCYGIGPAIDVEDGPQGYGAHSDQERIRADELYRFVKFQWDVVNALAKTK